MRDLISLLKETGFIKVAANDDGLDSGDLLQVIPDMRQKFNLEFIMESRLERLT